MAAALGFHKMGLIKKIFLGIVLLIIIIIGLILFLPEKEKLVQLDQIDIGREICMGEQYDEEIVCIAAATRNEFECDVIEPGLVKEKCKSFALVGKQYDAGFIDCSKLNFDNCSLLEGKPIDCTDELWSSPRGKAICGAITRQDIAGCQDIKETHCDNYYFTAHAYRSQDITLCQKLSDKLNRIICTKNLEFGLDCADPDCLALHFNDQSYCELYEGHPELVSSCKRKISS